MNTSAMAQETSNSTSKSAWTKVTNPDGKGYYWNTDTDQTCWDTPGGLGSDTSRKPEDAWEKVKDDAGREYWWNTVTDETRWSSPYVKKGRRRAKMKVDKPKIKICDSDSSQQKENEQTGNEDSEDDEPAQKVEESLNSPSTSIGHHRRSESEPVTEVSSPINGKQKSPGRRNQAGSAKKSSSKHGHPGLQRDMSSSFKMRRNKLFNQIRQTSKDNKHSRKPTLEKLNFLRKDRSKKSNRSESPKEIGSPFQVEHKVTVKFDPKELRYSGIPLEWGEEANRQFGLPLASCPRIEVPGYEGRIPAVLVMLREALIRLDGFSAEGLFRIAPESSECAAVKKAINTGHGPKALEECTDPHVFVNLIKQYFRELEPNLLDSIPRDTIMRIAELPVGEDCEKEIENIEEPERSLFLWLLDLLTEVSEKEAVNRMTVKNLAIVVAPNLFSTKPNANPMEALVLSQKTVALVTSFLTWRATSKANTSTTKPEED